MGLHQVEIGAETYEQAEEILDERIGARKKELGEKLLVLCHHYQQEAVYKFADMTGDSLKLAKHAAACKDKSYIVFCGVHFMERLLHCAYAVQCSPCCDVAPERPGGPHHCSPGMQA